MDYAALKSEIALPAYAGMTDDQIAATLNAKTVAGPDRQVPIIVLTKYLREAGAWLPIRAAAVAGTSQGAIAAVDYNSDLRAATIDMDAPIVAAMLADLVGHGLLTQAQSDAMVALKATTIPYLSTLGWSVNVTAADVAAARENF